MRRKSTTRCRDVCDVEVGGRVCRAGDHVILGRGVYVHRFDRCGFGASFLVYVCLACEYVCVQSRAFVAHALECNLRATPNTLRVVISMYFLVFRK